MLEPRSGMATARHLPAVVVQVDPNTGLPGVGNELVIRS